MELCGREEHKRDSHSVPATTRAVAQRMPLSRTLTDRSINDVLREKRIGPNRDGVICLFLGPARRNPVREIAAVVIFRPEIESSLAVTTCEALPYDWGGANKKKYSGMSKKQVSSAKRELMMGSSEYREYLGQFLHCAFDSPRDYLTAERGPSLNYPERYTRSAAKNGLAKSYQRDDSSCWTPEIRLCVQDGELNLEDPQMQDCIYKIAFVHGDGLSDILAFIDIHPEIDVAFIPEVSDGNTVRGVLNKGIQDSVSASEAHSWTVKEISSLLGVK